MHDFGLEVDIPEPHPNNDGNDARTFSRSVEADQGLSLSCSDSDTSRSPSGVAGRGSDDEFWRSSNKSLTEVFGGSGPLNDGTGGASGLT